MGVVEGVAVSCCFDYSPHVFCSACHFLLFLRRMVELQQVEVLCGFSVVT